MYERVKFRVYNMSCCGHILCWVNPRHPTFCPQCGENVFVRIKQWITLSDDNAVLTFEES